MLSNRGLFLEVIPILRLCVEMIAWAAAVFPMIDQQSICATSATRCVGKLKALYLTAGEIYGYLSRFAHWEWIVHSTFLRRDDANVAIIHASRKYRAMSLALCVLIVDILVEVARGLYASEAKELVYAVQGTLTVDSTRKTSMVLAEIALVSDCSELIAVQGLLA
jgi:hypothetical protein